MRWCLSLMMLVIAAAFGPSALAHGGAPHHGREAALPMKRPAAQVCGEEAGQVVLRSANPDILRHCHAQATPGASCCCPAACAALLAPITDLAFARSQQSSRLADRRVAFRDLRHGPPLPPPRR